MVGQTNILKAVTPWECIPKQQEANNIVQTFAAFVLNGLPSVVNKKCTYKNKISTCYTKLFHPRASRCSAGFLLRIF